MAKASLIESTIEVDGSSPPKIMLVRKVLIDFGDGQVEWHSDPTWVGLAYFDWVAVVTKLVEYRFGVHQWLL